MPRRHLRPLLLLCAIAITIAVAQTVVGLGAGLLFLAPALVLALPLLAGRYLGAERLQLIAARRSPRRQGAPMAARPPHGFPRVLPRGGLLIAASLAVRPPPVARSLY
jgi:hypothetical protein